MELFWTALVAVGTLALAAVTFYISVVEPRLKKPSLEIKFENKKPFCVPADVPKDSFWIRLKVTNSGKSTAKACVGRVVQFIDSKGPTDDEPVRLHWVGTPWPEGPELLSPIDLAPRDSWFLDVLFTVKADGGKTFLFVGAIRVPVNIEGVPEPYNIALMPLVRTDHPLPSGIERIQITVYGDNVKPCPAEYFMKRGSDYTDIRLEPVEETDTEASDGQQGQKEH